MQLSSELFCEITVVMCFKIVNLNYFPLNYICKGTLILILIHISMTSFNSFWPFHYIYFIYHHHHYFLYCFIVWHKCPFRVWSLVFFFCFIDVQKLFGCVNEHNLSDEKQHSGCQSMIAWFSNVRRNQTRWKSCVSLTFRMKYYILIIFIADILTIPEI